MAGVDLGRYRRIVQIFWDPEPTNDRERNEKVWCLGCAYELPPNGDVLQDPIGFDKDGQARRDVVSPISPASAVPLKDTTSPSIALPASSISTGQAHVMNTQAQQIAPIRGNAPATPPDSAPGSVSSSLAFDDGSDAPEDRGWPPGFLDDFESKFWMTYRCDFQMIPKSTDPRASSTLSLSMRIKSQLVDQAGFTSDSGWGCMVRSGQSLLANTMSLQTLGRGWRRGPASDGEKELLAKFADDPRAPYSIHEFVQHGAAACGKYPGQWFGPSATARCIKALVEKHEPLLRVYSTGDGPDVYRDRFMRVARPDGKTFHPTLILVGTRLGIDKITPVYWEALTMALKMPQSVGIAGGRPASSHYFIGAQGQFLFYLDPHHTRAALPYHRNPADYSQTEVDSAHTRRLRRLHVREMDPSMLIGFLIQDEEDWDEWASGVKHVQGKPIINVADYDPLARGSGEREAAIDEVETLSDDDADTVLAT